MRKAQSLIRAKKMKSNSGHNDIKPVVQGVVFDMDGTLTVPCIDFAEMRRRVGILEGDILDVIGQMNAEDAAAAHRVLAEFEAEALQDMQVMPGVRELAATLDGLGVPRGLITRNVKPSVEHFHAAFGAPPFSPALARCFTPYKPAPDALLHICDAWGIPPAACVMVGDSAKDDVVCGNRAGATTVLIDVERRYVVADLPSEMRPTFHVFSMHEVAEVLRERCELRGRASEGAAITV